MYRKEVIKSTGGEVTYRMLMMLAMLLPVCLDLLKEKMDNGPKQ